MSRDFQVITKDFDYTNNQISPCLQRQRRISYNLLPQAVRHDVESHVPVLCVDKLQETLQLG